MKLRTSKQLQKRRSLDKLTYDIKDDDVVPKVRAFRIHAKLNQQENPQLRTGDVQVSGGMGEENLGNQGVC